jgi:hypothetical protein
MTNETLEEAAKNYANEELSNELTSKVGNFYGFSSSFTAGAKWQAERMYTDEDIDKQISDFKYDLKESTSTFVKQNCEGAIFGLNRLKQFKKDKL